MQGFDKKRAKMLIPGHVLSNIDLSYYSSKLGLKDFRGVL